MVVTNFMEMNFELLANADFWYVRGSAAQNPNCPIHLLEKLADDKDGFVRHSVAQNPNCPQYLKDYINAKSLINYYGNKF
jgi:hypothetical protein